MITLVIISSNNPNMKSYCFAQRPFSTTYYWYTSIYAQYTLRVFIHLKDIIYVGCMFLDKWKFIINGFPNVDALYGAILLMDYTLFSGKAGCKVCQLTDNLRYLVFLDQVRDDMASVFLDGNFVFPAVHGITLLNPRITNQIQVGESTDGNPLSIHLPK